MAPVLPQASVDAIKAHVDSMVKGSDIAPPLPCGLFHAIDKQGRTLASEASGTYGLSNSEPLATDAIFWLASCTKVVTAIACMQLVEGGKIGLDDHARLYQICPELRDKKVLQDDGNLVARTGDITLRQLLCHSAGFGYPYSNPKLKKWTEPAGVNEFGGHAESILSLPLVHQPGKQTMEYGVSSDWAGLVVERVSGMRLDDYFKNHILRPIGVTSMSFYPTQKMRENLVGMHRRGKAGDLVQIDHPLSRVLLNGETKLDETFNSGGAGLFGSAPDFAAVLGVLINGGVAPKTSTRILNPVSVDALFANQYPDQPNVMRGKPKDPKVPAAKPWMTNELPESFPQPGDPPQGFTLSASLLVCEGVAGARGNNTLLWAGIANLLWWADRERGVAAVVTSSVLPLGEPGLFVALAGCQQATYEGLNKLQGQ